MNNEIDLELFAKRFESLVKDNKTDINFLANYLGISKSTLYRYLNGEMEPKKTTIKCIADFYNVTPSWLMGSLPYTAIYEFSSEREKKLLNTIIIYIIQNNIPDNEIITNKFISSLLEQFNENARENILRFIQKIIEKNKDVENFNLEEFIDSIKYIKHEQQQPKIDALYMHLAKEAQDLSLDEEDVDYIINFYKKHKK